MNITKKYNIAFAVLIVLYILTPLVEIIGSLSGYNCIMSGKTAYIVVLMLCTVVIACSLFVFKPKNDRLSILLSAILFIASFVNLFAFREYLTLACISVIAALVIFATRLPKTIAIIVSAVMSCLLIMVIFFISVLGLFGTFGENTVYKEVESSNSKYTAQIIINDQGSLGGSTFVMLKNNADKKRFLFYKFNKKDVKLYIGKYTEYTNITIEWQNDKILLINGTEYVIENNDIK